MPSTRTFCRTARGLTFAAAVLFATLPSPAQAQPASAVPMPTGAFSLPPSADPLTYHPTLTFDVTSVRETVRTPGPLNMGIVAPPHSGQFSISMVTLELLTQMAYSFGPTFQIAGVPDWAQNRWFRVEGKCDHSVDDTLAKLTNDQARLERLNMVQSMLADRFHMKAHWETRTGNVYNLVIAKGGLKMQPTKAPTPEPDRPDGSSSAPAFAAGNVQAHGSRQGIEIDCTHFNTRAIGLLLNSQLKATIVDKTGLPATSFFDIALQFNEDNSTDTDAYPSLFTAIEEQLGLKLEPAKGPVDTLVIDHAEMPTEN